MGSQWRQQGHGSRLESVPLGIRIRRGQVVSGTELTTDGQPGQQSGSPGTEEVGAFRHLSEEMKLEPLPGRMEHTNIRLN